MSRIDDDHQAQRAAERVALDKRNRELRAKEGQARSVAFQQLVGQQKAEKGQSQQALNKAQETYQQVFKEGYGSVVGKAMEDARKTQQSATTHKSQERGQLERSALQGRQAAQSAQSSAAQGRTSDARAGEGAASSRQSDGAQSRERLVERREEGLASSSAQGQQSSGRGDTGDLRVGQQGQGKGQGGEQGGNKDADAQMGFRLNPALMAPAPLAQPKDAGASARFRALANEIAQKIVERVRVGTNAAGHAEFQIDLRSNVLSGLSINISGSNGKIRATFSGSDRKVLKMLRDQSDGLKSALAGRGLTLEELKIEEKA
ncbi:MAG: flagellar hook-length control protein FliK [Myxococcaceae bacterium]